MIMIKKLIKFTLVGLIMIFWSCSGTQSETPEQQPFDDQNVQTQVDQLMDKIDENPSNPVYRRQLAELYTENGRNLEALKVLEENIKLDPNDTESLYQYAQIAENMGDTRRAYTSYKAILQSASGNDYLDRIAPKFVDAFSVTKIIGTSANEAFGSFSGDGSKIIYQSDQNGNWDLFEYTVADKSVKQLTSSPANEESPVYNPNGRYFAYTSTVEDHRNVDYNMKVRDIFLYDSQNDRHINVTLNSSDDWNPRYSQNGKFISFVSERDDLRDVDFTNLVGDVYLMEQDGRFQLRLTKNMSHDGGAVIAPGSSEDNGIIYYDSDQNGKFDIYKTNFKGDKTTQVTFNPQFNDASPSISPNGDKIAFLSDRDGNYEIYMMNADGSAQMRLTSNPAEDSNPVFSTDGAKILFQSNRNGNYDLFLLDLNTQGGTPQVNDVINNIDKALQTL